MSQVCRSQVSVPHPKMSRCPDVPVSSHSPRLGQTQLTLGVHSPPSQSSVSSRLFSMGRSPTCPLPPANSAPGTAPRLPGYLPGYMVTWADPSQISCAAALDEPTTTLVLRQSCILLPLALSLSLTLSSDLHLPSLSLILNLPLRRPRPRPRPLVAPTGWLHDNNPASRPVCRRAVPRAVALGLETLPGLRRQQSVGLVTFLALTELNSTRPNPSSTTSFPFPSRLLFALTWLALQSLPVSRQNRNTGPGTPQRTQSKLITPDGRPRPPKFHSSLPSPSSFPHLSKPTRLRRNCDCLCRRQPCTAATYRFANYSSRSGAYQRCYSPSAGFSTALSLNLFCCSVFFCITTTFTRVHGTPPPQQTWCLLLVHRRRRLGRARS